MRWLDVQVGNLLLGYTRGSRRTLIGEALPHTSSRLKIITDGTPYISDRRGYWVICDDTDWELLI